MTDAVPAPPQPSADPGRSDLIATLARWGVLIIIVGVLVNLAMAAQSIRSGATAAIHDVDPKWLMLAAVLGLVPNFFHALRIRIWAGFLGTPASMRQCLRAAFGTELGSSVSPKAIGGAPVKIGLLMETGQRAGTAASIALLNNFDDTALFAGIMPLVAIGTRAWEIPEVATVGHMVAGKALAGIPWIAGAVVLIVLIVRFRRRRRRASNVPPGGRVRAALARGRHDFFAAWSLVGRRGKLRFGVSVVLTGMQWLCRWSVGTAVLYGLGMRVDPVLFLLLQWVVYMMMIFVPTPGAALGAEASFAAVLGPFVPGGLIGLVAASWRFFTFYLVLVVGLVAVPLLAPRRQVEPVSPLR